jgi:hypothetical protein
MKIIRLTESDITKIVKRVLLESGQKDCLSSYDIKKNANQNSKNIANKILSSCNCADESLFSNWDENEFSAAVQSIRDKKTYDEVYTLLDNFIDLKIGQGWYAYEGNPILYLSNQMMDSWEGGQKNKILSVVKKFKPDPKLAG